MEISFLQADNIHSTCSTARTRLNVRIWQTNEREFVNVTLDVKRLWRRFRGQESVCLVTIAIGDQYKKDYDKVFRANHERYCKISNYDFRLIDKFIDKTANHKSLTSLQKILVCEPEWAQQYDFIIFVDADVVISRCAPQLHSLCANTKAVGIVDEYSQPTKETRISIQRNMGWEDSAQKYYALHDFDIKTEMVLNTEVMVFQPRYHKSMLRKIYDSGKDTALEHPRGFHYEQALIGYNLIRLKKYFILPNEWNAIWALEKYSGYRGENLKEFSKSNHIVHFAGGVDIESASDVA